ncbi:MAG TPA: Ig-like domain-containing protein, partial [Thermoplasmata archaeon]|nr:Ig-like domain-containing protein [Thermoplasmata archaeon]
IPAGIDTTRAVVNFTVRDLVGNIGRNNSPVFRIDSRVPVIDSSSPAKNETLVRPDVVILVNLSEPVRMQEVNATAILHSSKGDVGGKVNWTGNRSFRFRPLQNLSLATRYYLNFTSSDFAGNRLAGSFWFRTLDNRPPEITINKPDKSTVVNGVDPIDITYFISDETGVLPNSIVISRSYTAPPEWVTIVSGWNNPSRYTWLANESIEAPVAYIKVEARDLDGNPGSKESEAFRVDTLRPRVVRSDPVNGSDDIPLDGSFIFVFSEPMANITPAVTFSLQVGQVSMDWTSRSTLQVSHSARLDIGKLLTVIVSDAWDEAGNPMSSSYHLEGNTTIFPSKAHADGIVVSSEGAVLENVIVKAKNATTDLPELTTTTSKDGSFLLENLPPGPYVITFSLAGYRTTTIQRALPAGLLTHLQDIVLFPADSTLPAYLPLFVLLLAVIGLIVLFILISRRMSVASEGEELKAYLRTGADGEVEKPSEDGDGDDEPVGAEGPPDDPVSGKKKEEAAASEV